MRQASDPDSDALNQIERLVEELRAVEQWDADYWRKGGPEAFEVLAFAARRKRRSEILSQLLKLVPRLEIKQPRRLLPRRQMEKAIKRVV